MLFAYKAKVVCSAIVKGFRNSQLEVATIRKYTNQQNIFFHQLISIVLEWQKHIFSGLALKQVGQLMHFFLISNLRCVLWKGKFLIVTRRMQNLHTSYCIWPKQFEFLKYCEIYLFQIVRKILPFLWWYRNAYLLYIHVPVTILKFCMLLFDRRLQLVIMLCCIASKYRCYSNVFLHTLALSSNAIENYMSRKVMDWSSYLFRCVMNIRIIFVFEQQTASWINLQL